LEPGTLLIVLICIMTCGTVFFSVNRIVLRVYSRVKLIEAFNVRGKEKLIDGLEKNRDKYILACDFYRLLLNLCIVILLTAAFTNMTSSKITTADLAGVFVIALVLFCTFSLAIPESLSKYAGEKILASSYGLIVFFDFLCRPVSLALGLFDSLMRRLAGVTESTPEEQQGQKQEEFLNGLEQRKIEGVVDEEEQEMIENVLELSDTTVDEILTPRTDITAIEVNSDLCSIIETINQAGHSRFPVYEENIDNIIGLIYAKDLLAEIGKDPAEFKLQEKLRKAYFVPESKPLRSLLHEFQNQKLHIAVVLDEYGGTAGIVTLEDILEELVGEITDEYEQTPTEQIRRIDENTIQVDARTYIDEINDQYQMNLPDEEDYETVGGFVFAHLGYIPKTNEIFEFQNLKFTVTAAEARRIKRVRIQCLVEGKNAD